MKYHLAESITLLICRDAINCGFADPVAVLNEMLAHMPNDARNARYIIQLTLATLNAERTVRTMLTTLTFSETVRCGLGHPSQVDFTHHESRFWEVLRALTENDPRPFKTLWEDGEGE